MINKILYSFSIEPILTGGVAGNDGKYITLSDGQDITSINFHIVDDQQVMTLENDGTPVTGYDEIKFSAFNITNNVFNPTGSCTFSCVIDASTTGSRYNFNNPIVDIIREGDIFRAYYQSLNDSNPVQLMVGSIENINYSYNLGGLVINFSVGYLTNILSRSQLVQTDAQQNVAGITLTAYSPNQVVFGELLHGLLSETYINQTVSKTLYFGGNGEIIAAGKATTSNSQSSNGSAINANSYVYAVTPATDTKLNILLQILYPYQRVMYVDTNGNLIITPLTTFFDSTENWSLGINGEPDLIPCENISVAKNTTVLQNRSYCAMNQVFQQFNQSNINSNQANTGVSIATPPENLFPRAYDFVQSGLGLQTAFVIQAFDSNAFMQNSGLLNTAYNLPTLSGVTSVLKVDNQNIGYESGSTQDVLKYAMSLYASRSLAESLVNDTLVDITVDTILTYSDELGRFRNIPLNQMVSVPPVSNKMYDGQQQLFCYGFSLSFNVGQGSLTTLNLCKPYVFTGFWTEELVPI